MGLRPPLKFALPYSARRARGKQETCIQVYGTPRPSGGKGCVSSGGFSPLIWTSVTKSN